MSSVNLDELGHIEDARHPAPFAASRGSATEIFKEFTFEAAHRLPFVPDGHKCARLHGHSYRVEVHVGGGVHPTSGWIMDFADVKAAFAPLLDQLDHNYLNEIKGLENPTSEHLAAWIWERLEGPLKGLSRVIIRETCTSGCAYTGPAGRSETA